MLEGENFKANKRTKLDFSNCKSFWTFPISDNFIHSVDYLDDNLFLEAVSATMGLEEDVVRKVPIVLDGYLVYDKDNNLCGFVCEEEKLIDESSSDK